MGKITWLLLVPLIPSILIFVIFPDALFNFLPSQISDSTKVSASGAVGLYFCLIMLCMKYLKADKLDSRTRLRGKLLGVWSFVAQWIEKDELAQRPKTAHGKLSFTLDSETQRLFLEGEGKEDETHSTNETLHFTTDKVFVEPGKLTYLVGTKNPGDNYRRWLVELNLPNTDDFTVLYGDYHEIEGYQAGTMEIRRIKKEMAMATILSLTTVPVTIAAAALLWITGIIFK